MIHFWAVVGLIGAGKTSFLVALVEFLESLGFKVILVDENIEKFTSATFEGQEFNPLKAQYDDPEKWCGAFQNHVYRIRVEEQNGALEEATKWQEQNPEKDVFVLAGRCLRCDNIFFDVHREAGRIKDDQAFLHDQLCKIEPLPVPSLYIYLRTSVETCVERKEMRGREGEEDITELLIALEAKHEKVYAQDDPEVIIIDNNQPLSQDTLKSSANPKVIELSQTPSFISITQ